MAKPSYDTILGFFVLFVSALMLVVLSVGYYLTTREDIPPQLREGWVEGSSNNVSFEYPSALPTKYIRGQDWPPLVQVLPVPLECEEGGAVSERAGMTEVRSIDFRKYCVTEIIEGAAGTMYIQYAYAFELDEEHVVIFSFSTASPQCENYPEPERVECVAERNTFEMDHLIDQIADTARLD